MATIKVSNRKKNNDIDSFELVRKDSIKKGKPINPDTGKQFDNYMQYYAYITRDVK